MAPIVFRILLFATVIYAFVRGGRDERLVAAICAIGALMTHLFISPAAGRFQGIETSVLAIDLIVFAAFVAVALRSQRFWPLWVAGLQLTTILSHLFKSVNTDVIPRAYAASLAFWAYPIVLILAVGTWRFSHRDQRHHPTAP